MNDRLRFRAYVEDFCFYGDVKKSFMIDGVAVFGGREVGIDVTELMEQLKEQGFTDDEVEQVQDAYYFENEDFFSFDADYIEQCTGLRDTNGKMIYEGDIIKSKFDGLGRIVYDHGAFVVVWENGVWFYEYRATSTPIPLDTENIEVIGNVHNDRELLKGE